VSRDDTISLAIRRLIRAKSQLWDAQENLRRCRDADAKRAVSYALDQLDVSVRQLRKAFKV